MYMQMYISYLWIKYTEYNMYIYMCVYMNLHTRSTRAYSNTIENVYAFFTAFHDEWSVQNLVL